LKVSINGVEISPKGKSIIDSNKVDDMGNFQSKYGGDVKKYYPKLDVTVEVRSDRFS